MLFTKYTKPCRSDCLVANEDKTRTRIKREQGHTAIMTKKLKNITDVPSFETAGVLQMTQSSQ